MEILLKSVFGKKMKIDVYSVMRNEIQILPYFLRHYETFADRIFVWDDDSDDGTREVLDKHPKVVLLGLTEHGPNDHYWINKLWPQYKIISRGYADWCICVDADEFVYHPSILSHLEKYKDSNINQIKCAGYTMFSESLPMTDGQIYEEITYGVPDKWSTKTVVFNPEIDILYGIGRHRCLPKTLEVNYDFKLLHYRYLGFDYMVERCKKNGTNLERRNNLPDGTRGRIIDWYPLNKDKAISILEL